MRHKPFPTAPSPPPLPAPAPAPQGQPAAAAPKIQLPPVRVAAPPNLEVKKMPLLEHKILGVFQRLALFIFSGATREDIQEFQLTY